MLTTTLKTKLNNGDSPGSISGLGSALELGVNVMKATYDFSAGGGAIGDVVMRDLDGNPAVIPSGALITRVIIDVVTAALSAGAATVAVKAQSAADLLPDTAKASLSLDAKLDGTPVATAATCIKLTADRTVTATIGTAALTAGKIVAYVQYQ